MIERFIKTDTLSWNSKDCCRIHFGGCGTVSPYRADNESGISTDLDSILKYIAGRTSLEGIILSGEPLADPDIAGILGKLRRFRIPIRICTVGTHPEVLDDVAGALLADNVQITLCASPFSEGFAKAMPNVNPKDAISTLEMTSDIDISSEVEITAVPGVVTADGVEDVAEIIGKKTVLAIKQYYPSAARDADAKKLTPYSKNEGSALKAAASKHTKRAVLRGFRLLREIRDFSPRCG